MYARISAADKTKQCMVLLLQKPNNNLSVIVAVVVLAIAQKYNFMCEENLATVYQEKPNL